MGTGNQFKNVDGVGCLIMIIAPIVVMSVLIAIGFIFSPT